MNKKSLIIVIIVVSVTASLIFWNEYSENNAVIEEGTSTIKESNSEFEKIEKYYDGDVKKTKVDGVYTNGYDLPDADVVCTQLLNQADTYVKKHGRLPFKMNRIDTFLASAGYPDLNKIKLLTLHDTAVFTDSAFEYDMEKMTPYREKAGFLIRWEPFISPDNYCGETIDRRYWSPATVRSHLEILVSASREYLRTNGDSHSQTFTMADVAAFKPSIREQFCESSTGPCTVKGMQDFLKTQELKNRNSAGIKFLARGQTRSKGISLKPDEYAVVMESVRKNFARKIQSEIELSPGFDRTYYDEVNQRLIFVRHFVEKMKQQD